MTADLPSPVPDRPADASAVQIGHYQAVSLPQEFQIQPLSTGTIYRFAGAGMPASSISESMVTTVTDYIAQWEHVVSPSERSASMSFREVWQEAADYFEAIEGIETGRRG
jgi:hypothetical protein